MADEEYKYSVPEPSGALERFGGAKDPEYPAVGDDGFLGTDPIYQNAANKYDEPLGEVDEGDFTMNTPGEGPASEDKDARLGTDDASDDDEGEKVEKPKAPRRAAHSDDK